MFRRQGHFWTVVYHGVESRLRDMKGLRVLARLLAAPGTEFHPLELQWAVDGVDPDVPEHAATSVADGDAGDILDDRAKAEYREHLRRLAGEIEDARAAHHADRADALETEAATIRRHLAAALGLGSRSRRLGSDAERARVNLTKRLRAAIATISKENERLGRHLDVTVRTGSRFSYNPDPRVPAQWSGPSSSVGATTPANGAMRVVCRGRSSW